MRLRFLILPALLSLTACWKPIDTSKSPIAGNVLALEFAQPVKYVLELKIDGQEIPIRYGRKNRILYVEGLQPGDHSFSITSLSYVFGPEVGNFTVKADQGAYSFIQARKYRSSTPKNNAQVSIRAYRKKLKQSGIDAKSGIDDGRGDGGKIRAYFRGSEQ